MMTKSLGILCIWPYVKVQEAQIATHNEKSGLWHTVALCYYDVTEACH
jgi:hypothetical protein